MFGTWMIAQMHHLDAVGIHPLIVNQTFRKYQCLRRSLRLDVDLALEALETMAIGIQEILVEGNAIRVHLALPSFRHAVAPAYSQASISASRWRLRSTI
jgi:hypothetical protein